MAGGSGIVRDGGGRAGTARVTDNELHVRVAASGASGNVTIIAPLPLPVDLAALSVGTVPVSIAGTVDVDIVAATIGTVPVDDGGLSLTVDGTVAVSNFPASQTVDDGGGSITVDGTVAVSALAGDVEVVQPTHDDLNANANIQLANVDVSAGNPVPCSVLQIVTAVEVEQADHDDLNANANMQVGDVDVSAGNPVPMSDAGGSITVDGTVAVSTLAGDVEVVQPTHDDLNLNANIQVGDADAAIGNPVPTHFVSQTTDMKVSSVIGSVVDATIVSPLPLPVSIDAQTINLTMLEPREALSGGALGVQFAVVIAAGTTTVHTTAVGVVDQVYLFLANDSAVADTVVLDLGSGTNNVPVHVPAHQMVVALDGHPIGGPAVSKTITAQKTLAGAAISAFGYRIENP